MALEIKLNGPNVQNEPAEVIWPLIRFEAISATLALEIWLDCLK